jgi:hypothetical protein
MSDLVFLASTAAFFVLGLVYVYGCESLRGGDGNA